MNWMRGLLMISVVSLTLWCLGCDTTTNTNSGNYPARNDNSAVASPTPTPATSNSNNGNGNVSRSDVESNLDKYKKQAKDAGRKVGDTADDVWIWVKTRADLAAADDLRDSTIDVDVTNNVVTLTGSVASKAQKDRAGQLAKAIEGVKSVTNSLRVAADGSPNATSDTKAPKATNP